MDRFPLILLLATACAVYAVAQSGRRIAPGRTVPTAPIQPPVNPEPEIPEPKKPSPNLTFLPESVVERRIRALDNSSFRLADFRGKVVVINIWATWCGPCRREVPEYEKVRTEFKGRDVEFIALSTEDPATESQKVRKFASDTNFGFLLGWADRELARTLMNGRSGIPQTLVIDSSGIIVSHWVGYARGSGNRLRAAVNQALE